MNSREVQAKLKSLGVSPKKSLGQNFLVNEKISGRIVERAVRDPFELAVEIGPGLGALTERLRSQVKALKLIELDRHFAHYWREQGCEVLEEDALNVNWSHLVGKARTLLVSNLPYQISSSLVVEMSLGPDELSTMVLMFQKEVAQRILAKPASADYGLLSVMAQACWSVEPVVEAGPKDFFPPPQVGSRVLAFVRKAHVPADRRLLLKLVKLGFSQRRKKLISNLESMVPKPIMLDWLPQNLLSVDCRAEELSSDKWMLLANLVDAQQNAR